MKHINSNLLLLIVLIFALSSFEVSASKYKKIRSKAEDLIVREDFEGATEILNQGTIDYPNEKYLNLLLGVCYLSVDSHEKEAIKNLEIARDAYKIKDNKSDKAIEARFYLGQAYHLNYQFQEAIDVLEKLKKSLPDMKDDQLLSIDKELKYCYNALKLSKNQRSFKITNLGSTVNTPYDEHSPIVSADEEMLVFTSNRKGTGDMQTPDGLYYEDIYVSHFRFNKWTPAENIGTIINTEANNASISLSADGKTLFIYMHDGISGDIYKSEMTFEGWTEPEKLPQPINTQYSETHASMTVDGNTIFFSSDRPSGYGGKDIYMIRKLPNGDWGKILNLGDVINTEGDEESPFIHPDGKTLYFCSTEHTSVGGYDIFKTEVSDSMTWSVPENIGCPINTPDDDLFYIPTANGQRVYFASRRSGGEGRSDLYLIEFDESDPRSLGVVAGYIFDSNKKPFGEVTITLTDKESNEIMGYYRPNPGTGKYVMIVPVGKTYEATYVTENETIIKEIEVAGRRSYKSGNWATYVDPIKIKE